MAKRKSPLREMIKESLTELKNSEFPSDPTFEGEDGEVSGPERFAKGQKHKDEVIIDSLLSGISGKDGYFLKLKKEMRPNEWMLMKTIENEWRNWADMESAVADIVKEHTKKSPAKWGSGPYRIEYACRGGMRGQNYQPVDFYINAEEEFVNTTVNGVPVVSVADPTTQVTAQLDMLGRLTEIINANKTPGLDPAKTQEQIASAFEKGLQTKAGEGNASAQMMTAMMTGLMGMMTAIATNKPLPVETKSNDTDTLKGLLETLKTFGVLGNQTPQEKQKTVIDFIAELKLLGMDLFKKDDPIAQIGQLKQLASIAGEFMGMGGSADRPGIMEKIVDALGPVLPTIIKDVKDTMGNAVQAQIEAGKNIERARIQIAPSQGQPQMTQQAQPQQQTENNPQIQAFFNGLHDAVKTNNRMFYPVVYTSLLQDAQGQALINGLVSGTHTAKDVIELLQMHGGDRFKDSEFVVKHLVGYTNGFIMWIRQMVNPSASEQMYAPVNGNVGVNGSGPKHGQEVKEGEGYDVECPICEAVYQYTSETDFQAEVSKECGAVINGVVCPGTLQPVAKV